MEDENSLFESHEILKTYINQKNLAESDVGVTEYLKHLKYPPITDFPKDLEWFNVSQGLSFTKQLKGKIVLLDFFTYCCINCMHILPTLKDIENEFSIEDGLVVIGVHSAKFDNEKDSKNIRSAVQRYNISHPVVNDNQSSMWKKCDVQCWPTLLLLGPSANPIVMLTGEGNQDGLHLCIRASLSFYSSKNEISHHKIPLQPAYHFLPDLKGPLLFPGKITCYNDPEILAISDTGNHRILIINSDGTLIRQVGGSGQGFKDGNLEDAQFDSPQGVVFKNKDVLFVADTENHAIRKIDLQCSTVTTIAGIGEQGEDYKGGRDGKVQEISSPWDLALYKTSDSKEILFIAMAGTHQIWALFLDGMVWWKNQNYSPGTCICIAGSGREENRNNQYPHAAAFAQPSGLVVCVKNKEIYIADSESSSIRRLSLIDGKVTAVVGGDRNPNNLFAFGDKDGKQYDAKLQHVLGVAISKEEDELFIADTYNHKIKKVHIETNTISTINLNEKFNEPAGLCASPDGRKLYIADTNNHCIKILHCGDANSMVVEKLHLKLDNGTSKKHLDKSKLQIISPKDSLHLNSSGGKLIFKVNLVLTDDLKLADGAPQNWIVDLPSAAWACTPSNRGSNVLNTDLVLNIPPMQGAVDLDFVYNLVTCTGDTCLPRKFLLRQSLNFTNDSPLSLEYTIDISINKSTIIITKAIS